MLSLTYALVNAKKYFSTPKATAGNAVAKVSYHVGDGNHYILTSNKSKQSLGVKEIKELAQSKESTEKVILETQNANGILSSLLEGYKNEHKISTVYLSTENIINFLPTMYELVNHQVGIVVHLSAELENEEHKRLINGSDISAVLNTGFIILYSSSAKQCQNNSILSYIYANFFDLQVLHIYDGILNDVGTATLASDQVLDSVIQRISNKVGEVNRDCLQDVVSWIHDNVKEDLPNLESAVEYFGAEDAEYVIVAMGTMTQDIKQYVHEHGSKIGLVSIQMLRPWSADFLVKSLPKTVKKLGVVDGPYTTQWGPLYLDILTSLSSLQPSTGVKVVPFHVRSKVFDTDMAKDIYAGLSSSLTSGKSVVTVQYNGTEFTSTNTESTGDISAQVDCEDARLALPYAQILAQAFPTDITASVDLPFINTYKSLIPSTIVQESIGFGLGVYLSNIRQSEDMADKVKRLKARGNLSPRLAIIFSKWLDNQGEDNKTMNAIYQEMETLISTESNDLENLGTSRDLNQIKENLNHLKSTSRWIVTHEKDWARDASDADIHSVIASGENINLLIIDNTPRQPEDGKPNASRKDVGLYAMNYGNCYVASVAVYSSYSQTLRSLMEADAYKGPSIVLAYAPPAKSEDFNALEVLKETKLAVDDGFWPLYRWNPKLDEPFELDSIALKKSVQTFLDNKNYLAQIVEKHPQLSQGLTRSLDKNLQDRAKALNSFGNLLDNLNREPLLILFGSDGGNAEGIARRLNGEANLRGLNSRVMAANDCDFDTFVEEEKVVFVLSTAGQGEFPLNIRTFWKTLSAASVTLTNKFAVFGLGDSHYWPLPEDAHYFAKAPVDLDKKLAALGGERLCDLGIGDDQAEDGYDEGLKKWSPGLWESLGVDKVDIGDIDQASLDPNALPPDDDIKEGSSYLRGTIAEGLQDESTGALAVKDTKLTKFHGIYQQDDRDLREQRKANGLEPAYSFMIRVRLPGGVTTPQQWIKMDDLSVNFANNTLKLTTRQAYQLHGVLKKNLKHTIAEINTELMDTLAACGDVNRNVMCNPNPCASSVHARMDQLSRDLSAHLTPQTSAYHEIWLDKKKISSTEDVETLYGPTYLPRKFKIAIACPPNNDVDVTAHDLGFVAILDFKDGNKNNFDADNVIFLGYTVTVGGGMGSTHNNKKTFPRLADPFAFVETTKECIEIAEAIVLTQRDHGDRVNRKHARMKYTIEDHGLEWFKEQVESRLGYNIKPPRAFKFDTNGDRYGWTKGTDGLNYYSLFVENGRVKDTPELQLKTGLREIAGILEGDFRLTGNQNLILGRISDSHKVVIEKLFQKYGIGNEGKSKIRLNSMACVALPTCALAMAESERYLPSLIGKIEERVEDLVGTDNPVTVRMTGCPNGCARPYVAEIAFVGKAPHTYNMYLGGGFAGDRLNKLYKESVQESEILNILTPLLKNYVANKKLGERFGDFVIRHKIIQATTAGNNFHDNLNF